MSKLENYTTWNYQTFFSTHPLYYQNNFYILHFLGRIHCFYPDIHICHMSRLFGGWNLRRILSMKARHIQRDRSTAQYQIQSPNHFLKLSLVSRLIVLLLMYLRRGSREYVTLRFLKVLLTKALGLLECHRAMLNQSSVENK